MKHLLFTVSPYVQAFKSAEYDVEIDLLKRPADFCDFRRAERDLIRVADQAQSAHDLCTDPQGELCSPPKKRDGGDIVPPRLITLVQTTGYNLYGICSEEYVPPKEDERPWEMPPKQEDLEIRRTS